MVRKEFSRVVGVAMLFVLLVGAAVTARAAPCNNWPNQRSIDPRPHFYTDPFPDPVQQGQHSSQAWEVGIPDPIAATRNSVKWPSFSWRPVGRFGFGQRRSGGAPTGLALDHPPRPDLGRAPSVPSGNGAWFPESLPTGFRPGPAYVLASEQAWNLVHTNPPCAPTAPWPRGSMDARAETLDR